MWINKEHWKTENIVKGFAKIPTHRAHVSFWAAVAGTVMFIIGLLLTVRAMNEGLKVPDPLLLTAIGFANFSLFLPLSFIVYLGKELQKTKERVEELANKKD